MTGDPIKMRHRRILIRKSPWFDFFTASLRGNARPDALRRKDKARQQPKRVTMVSNPIPDHRDAERRPARSHAERGNEELQWLAWRGS